MTALRFTSATLVMLAAFVATFAGCGSDGDSAQSGGSGASGASAANGGGPSGGSLNIGLDGSAAGGGIGNVCAGELSTAELIPLDIYIMLDASSSMTEFAGGSTTLTKWDAVTQAITEFLEDRASDGIAVGIQYFPQRKPNAPDSCTDNASCGDSGPCWFKICQGYPDIAACDTNGDCGVFGPCTPFGLCENDTSWICQPVGSMCGDDPNGVALGACAAPTYYCIATALCDAAAYATPAVPIAALPDAAPTLIASVQGFSLRADALTPTGPALQGAVSHAQDWARANPSHRVVTLLATDGLPTECTPLEIADVAAVAQSGAMGDPAISTFVIGVIGPSDVEATSNLNAIAVAGGTESAFIVDPMGDVGQEFLDALNTIRGTKLACEFAVPAPTAGQTLDFSLVNVQFESGGQSTRLLYVGDPGSCDPTEGGWHYDVDPAVAMPTKIVACPSSCETFESAVNGSVQIELGCQTVVR